MTSETFGSYPPPPPPPPPSAPTAATPPTRLLRRSRTNRVAAGVSSGLGDYFGVDPVLFRVLFATSAFFGGAGILAYLLAWAAIPEAGTERAPIDGWVSALRRRHIPIWLVAAAAGLLLWAVAFSWWAPWPFFPIVAVVVLLVVFYGRRETPPAAVTLTKSAQPVQPAQPGETAGPPTWVAEGRSWFEEAREAARERRRRSLPIRLGILGGIAGVLIVLGIIDAVSSVQFQYYFWAVLAVLVIGLLVGAATRRLPISMVPLLAPAVIGTIAFAGSHMTLHDGIGQREWRPTDAPSAEYRLAFGQGTLDLRSMPAPTTPTTIRITAGAGQIKILAPTKLNLTVLANIHFGQLEVDGNAGQAHSGMGVSRTVEPISGAQGAPVTVDVHLADGDVTVQRG